MQKSGSVRLNIETYPAGKNQPTHPSMVTFATPWNGYKYWMAYSPYPYGDGEEENPCIAVSNDMLRWETPIGLANPIAANEETGCNELKDPHILYRCDMDRLEVWYLGRLAKHLGGDGITLLLFRKCSYDGVRWSDYEIMTDTTALSPSVIFQNGKYQLWEIGYNATAGSFLYRESEDGRVWGESQKCVISQKTTGLKLWHGAVSWDENRKQYVFVYIEYSKLSNIIYYCESDDGLIFSAPTPIIKLAPVWEAFYRPWLGCIGDQYVCLYGVINRDNSWYLSESIGSTPYQLRGISNEDCASMYQLPDSVCDTLSWKYRAVKTLRNLKQSLRMELFLSVPIAYAVFSRTHSLIPFLLPVYAVLTVAYLFWRKRRNAKWTIRGMVEVVVYGIFNAAIVSGVVALMIITSLLS